MSPFPLFNSFPPEIHALILTSCPLNDRTCLRLTCKYLYNLLPTPKTSPLTPIPLTNEDDDCETLHCTPMLGQAIPMSPSCNRWNHRQACHDSTFNNLFGDGVGKTWKGRRIKKCRSAYWADHCECFNFQLHERIREWMPKGLKYCEKCVRFTRRKRIYNNRCLHGYDKTRRQKPQFWTNRKGRGGFGRRLWKRWIRNSQMDCYEKRLRSQYKRNGTTRYDLRKWVPKDVNTTEIRTGASSYF